jgi:hypothetical protein
MSDRTPKQMREDALAWAKAGYPNVAVGRYRDAADQIERLSKKCAALALLLYGPSPRPCRHDDPAWCDAECERYRLWLEAQKRDAAAITAPPQECKHE